MNVPKEFYEKLAKTEGKWRLNKAPLYRDPSIKVEKIRNERGDCPLQAVYGNYVFSVYKNVPGGGGEGMEHVPFVNEVISAADDMKDLPTYSQEIREKLLESVGLK